MSGVAELALLSSAAQVISLGISVCNGIVKYYSAFRDSEDTIRQMLEGATQLTKTLVLISSRLEDTSDAYIGSDARQRVEESVMACSHTVERMRKKLDKLAATSDPSWSARVANVRRKSLYPFKESTIVKIKELCDDCSYQLQLAIEVLHIDIGLSTLSRLDDLKIQIVEITNGVRDVKGEITETKDGISTLVLHHTDEALTRVIDWLSPLQGVFERRQQEHYNLKGRQDRSGQNLLLNPAFQEWLAQPGKFLWCVGTPGIGKTVTASFVINHLQHITNQKAIGIAYVYCSYKETERENVRNLISSILQQLLSQRSTDAFEILDVYQKHIKSKTRPTLREFSDLLQIAIRRFSRTYVVVDALDECTDIDENRETFVSELTSLLPGISLFIVSRHLPHLERRLEMASRIELKASDEDIMAYVRERMAISQRLRGHLEKDPGLLQTIVTKITSKVKGMFLMARLYLDSLMTMITPRKVKAALELLPEGLNQVYDEVVHRIESQSPEDAALALRALYWIFHAVRPLTITEIQCALAIEAGDTDLDKDGEPDRDLLISVCAGMAVIDKETDTISLVHYTAQEYFQSSSGRVLEGGHVDLTRTCVTYLLFDDFVDGPSRSDSDLENKLTSHPLLLYAAQHWGTHARRCTPPSPPEVGEVITSLLLQDLRIEMISQIRDIPDFKLPNYSQTFTHNLGGLSLASSLELENAICALLDRPEAINVDAQDSNGRTALHHAVSRPGLFSQERNASAVILRRSDSWKIRSEAALAITSTLLAAGACPTIPDSSGQTPLHCAAAHNQVAIIEKLLSSGAASSLNTLDGYNGTPLYRAVEAGQVEAVQALLNLGSEVSVLNSYGQTVFHRAAEEGHLNVVQILVDYIRARSGDDELRRFVGIKDWYGWTAMYRAADIGHVEVAKLLVVAGRSQKRPK
jgi:ankyrin repeat protein